MRLHCCTGCQGVHVRAARVRVQRLACGCARSIYATNRPFVCRAIVHRAGRCFYMGTKPSFIVRDRVVREMTQQKSHSKLGQNAVKSRLTVVDRYPRLGADSLAVGFFRGRPFFACDSIWVIKVVLSPKKWGGCWSCWGGQLIGRALPGGLALQSRMLLRRSRIW